MTTVADIAGALQTTSRLQADAADPAASVWVSANAGTGKTHVLTQRVLRLLLAGTPPERILCLTYTKAAAAEMASRVFQTLSGWVTLAEAELAGVLFTLDGRLPDDEKMRRARTLFAKAIETPGGLKVQTIHAFSERLLQRFPLEAGVSPGFAILDDETAKELKAEAINAVLKTATDAPRSLLGDALRTAVAYAADDRFDEVLSSAIEERDAIAGAVRLDAGAGGNEPPLAAFEGLLRKHFNVGGEATEAALHGKLAQVASDADLRRLRDALAQSGGTTDGTRATALCDALNAVSDAAKAMALKRYFLTKDGGAAKSLMNKPVKDQNPELDEIATRTQGKFETLWIELQSLKGVTATVALTRLAGAALENYTGTKARRAALDFDDLIQRTRFLLSAEGGRTAWVLYKLDGGLDHILVDEAQDTSPSQWRIVQALASEFFAGEAARDVTRTLFAVGDEKQSIYSFQGAMPEKFAATGESFKAMAENAGETWRQIGLTLSFRSVAPVLDAVDQVFSNPERTPGLHAGGADPAIRHIARRKGQAGFIEVWPAEKAEAAPEMGAFEPLDEPARSSPVARLAHKIAATIDGWLKTGERLSSEDRPIRAGDVLILVNRRRPFAATMVAALKARAIPVAGADRMTLAEQIAVQDLVALGQFLTLPEDDLALAEVLKGPLIGFDDDDLMRLAVGRKGTLWKAVLDHASGDARFGLAAAQLKRWRARADFAPPYEFFATLLEKDRGREKLLARLGPEAADPIDEFLNLALSYDDGAPPSLTGFLTMLSETGKEVKRDMEQGADEVRVMTVHGAKGLEAPIVFLPDTCKVRTYRPNTNPLIRLPKMDRPESMAPPVFWHIKGAGDLAPVEVAKADLNTREREEYNRLLYVAMTRARDRLYVAGFESAKANGRDKGCWYDLVAEALGSPPPRGEGFGVGGIPTSDVLRSPPPDLPHKGGGEVGVIRRTCSQIAPPEPPKMTLSANQTAVALPEFALRPAPREITSSVPLAPSRLEPYVHDDTGEPGTPQRPERMRDEPAVVSPFAAKEDARFLRGTLTHALLQHLPAISPADWEAAAKGYVAMRARGLSKSAAQSIVKETLSILNDRDFADLFRAPSRAEVPLAAVIPRKGAKGPPLKISGQIDRLVERVHDVLIVDYKTNRVAPEHPSGVADAYLFQLAAYRLALEEIYPGKLVRAALLWTATPQLMEIPSTVLDAAEKRLFALDFARLDA